MHILITGGAGYIGSHASLELIKQGHKVTILDNLETGFTSTLDEIKANAGEFELINSDLRNLSELRSSLDNHSFDVTIHFAAYIDVKQSTLKPQIYFDNNVSGTNNLLTVLNEIGSKNVIFSSSAAVYGTPKSVPIDEDAPKSPDSPYGLSKLLTENILETYSQHLGFNVVALRYFNPCGSYHGLLGEKHTPEIHVIPRMLHAFVDSNFKFGVYGTDYNTPDGSAVRDFIHILDLVDAHIACIDFLKKNSGFHYFNVATGKGTSVLELIKTAEAIVGKELNPQMHPRRPGDPDQLIANPAKINRILNWKAKYGIKEILENAWQWEQKRQDSAYN